MEYTCFDYEINEKVAHIKLSRPEEFNSMNKAFWSELPHLIEDISDNAAARVIVLSGEGKHFCAGMDLANFSPSDKQPNAHSGMRKESGYRVTLDLQHTITCLEKARIPVIAAIQGYCFGVGLEFSLACDFRIVTKCAQLSLPEMKIGMIPGSGGSVRLARMIGLSRVKDMIMRGKRISGEEAYNYGLASEVVEIDELESATRNLVKELCLVSPLAQRAIKTVLNASQDAPLHVAIELEGETYGRLRSSSDFKEGVQSFVEKRKPVYTGK